MSITHKELLFGAVTLTTETLGNKYQQSAELIDLEDDLLSARPSLKAVTVKVYGKKTTQWVSTDPRTNEAILKAVSIVRAKRDELIDQRTPIHMTFSLFGRPLFSWIDQ